MTVKTKVLPIFLAIILALAPTYLIRFSVYSIPTTLLEVLIVVFLFLVLLNTEKNDVKRIRALGKVNWVICLFIFAGIISAIISPQTIKAVGLLKAYIFEPILIFYAAVIIIKTPQQLKIILQFLFAAAVIVSIFGLFQYYSFINLPIRFWGNGEEPQRIVSVFEYPNALSLYLAPLFGLFATLWLYNYPLTKNRTYSALGLITMAIALLLTFSRGAWIAAIIGLLYVFARRFGTKKIVLPTIAGMVALLFIQPIQDRVFLGISDPSSSVHLELIQVAAKKIATSPILGGGFYGFNTDKALYPHNFILNFWLELGILGLISFLWILMLVYQQHKKQPNILTAAASIYLVIVLVHGLVDVPYFKNDLALLFWFTISLFYIKS